MSGLTAHQTNGLIACEPRPGDSCEPRPEDSAPAAGLECAQTFEKMPTNDKPFDVQLRSANFLLRGSKSEAEKSKAEKLQVQLEELKLEVQKQTPLQPRRLVTAILLPTSPRRSSSVR